MKVKMLAVKNQRSRQKTRLGGWGRLKKFSSDVDAAFTFAIDAQVAKTIQGKQR